MAWRIEMVAAAAWRGGEGNKRNSSAARQISTPSFSSRHQHISGSSGVAAYRTAKAISWRHAWLAIAAQTSAVARALLRVVALRRCAPRRHACAHATLCAARHDARQRCARAYRLRAVIVTARTQRHNAAYIARAARAANGAHRHGIWTRMVVSTATRVTRVV